MIIYKLGESAQHLQDRHILHHVRPGPLDHRGVRAICRQGLPAALLETRGRPHRIPDFICSLLCDLLYLLFFPDFSRF